MCVCAVSGRMSVSVCVSKNHLNCGLNKSKTKPGHNKKTHADVGKPKKNTTEICRIKLKFTLIKQTKNRVLKSRTTYGEKNAINLYVSNFKRILDLLLRFQFFFSYS